MEEAINILLFAAPIAKRMISRPAVCRLTRHRNKIFTKYYANEAKTSQGGARKVAAVAYRIYFKVTFPWDSRPHVNS